MTQRLQRFSQVLLGALLAAILVRHLRYTWQSVAPFQDVLTDGPFQLYNALRRIDAGQLPGRDFSAFHGLGLPLLHWPLYRLLGGDLFASELARQIVSRVSGVIVYLAVSRLLFRSWWPGALWSIFSVGWPAPRALIIDVNIVASSSPANSLLPLRGLAPLVFLGVVSRPIAPFRREALLGLLLGVVWFMSLEQSIALFASATVAAAAALAVGDRMLAGRLARILAIGGLAALLLTAACCQGETLATLRYYLSSIPADQVWYFGAPPNPYLGDGLAESRGIAWRGGILAAAFVVWWFRGVRLMRSEGKIEDGPRLGLVLAIGAGYGLLSLATLLSMTYLQNLTIAYRMVLILASIEIYRAGVPGKLAELLAYRPRGASVGLLVAAGLAAVVMVESIVRTPRVKPFLAPEWEQHASVFPEWIRAADVPQTGTLWSTYAGIVEARLGIFQPDTDYIIHALGDRRAEYVAHFAELQPAFVQTLNSHSYVYEEWLQNTTWGFFERVALNYEPVAEANGAILWQRTKAAWREPAVERVEVPIEDGRRIQIPAGPSESRAAVITLEYETGNPTRVIPLVGQQARYLVTTEAVSLLPVSLPPRASKHEFPVPLGSDHPITLEVNVRGLAPWARIRIVRASVRYLPSGPALDTILRRMPTDPP